MKNSISAFIAALLTCTFAAGLPNKKTNEFTILFVGDILLANEADMHIRSKGIEYPFQKIRERLRKYDFIFGNLETPITTRGIPERNKPYYFRVDPQQAVCLRDLQIDGVSISNNHILDYNRHGLEDTIKFLTDMNIQYTGAGLNLEEARRPLFLKFGKTEVYIFAYCNRPPFDYYATDNRIGIAPLDLEIIRDDIERYKTDSNVVLISLHWGIEQTHIPQSYQVRLAHDIIDSGADGIIGHHPHWPQGIEVYNEKPIIYSLGNFINGYYNPIEKDNIMTAFHYKNSSLEFIKILSLAGKNREIKFQPYILKGKKAKDHLKLIQNISTMFNTDIEIRGSAGIIHLNTGPVRVGKTEATLQEKAKNN